METDEVKVHRGLQHIVHSDHCNRSEKTGHIVVVTMGERESVSLLMKQHHASFGKSLKISQQKVASSLTMV